MWTARREPLPGGNGEKLLVRQSGHPLGYRQVVTGWCTDPDFRGFFHQQLTSAPFSAYRWETPAITRATFDRPFECVLIDSPGLARHPDVDAFAEHFASASADDRADGISAFPNLRGDALMVVPHPIAQPAVYPHLAAFMRAAPEAQIDALWRRVGQAVLERLGDHPLWLNTAGAGVAWLHVRLDSRPKYYRHQPYRAP